MVAVALSAGCASQQETVDEQTSLLAEGDQVIAELRESAESRDHVRQLAAYAKLRSLYMEAAESLEAMPPSKQKTLMLRELIYWETKLGGLRGLQPQTIDLPEVDTADASPELKKFLDQVEEISTPDRERIEEWNRQQYAEERALDEALEKVSAMRAEG